jgi:DNA-binding Lrp family transcriptional regulator
MVTAFVLINIEDKNIKKIAETLLALPGIKEVYPVAGEYDLVVVIRVADNHALSELITEKIVHAQGILRTKTLFALQAFSNYDLQGFFKVQ